MKAKVYKRHGYWWAEGEIKPGSLFSRYSKRTWTWRAAIAFALAPSYDRLADPWSIQQPKEQPHVT